MTFTCTKCGNYSDDGDFEACICLRCIDENYMKNQRNLVIKTKEPAQAATCTSSMGKKKK